MHRLMCEACLGRALTVELVPGVSWCRECWIEFLGGFLKGFREGFGGGGQEASARGPRVRGGAEAAGGSTDPRGMAQAALRGALEYAGVSTAPGAASP